MPPLNPRLPAPNSEAVRAVSSPAIPKPKPKAKPVRPAAGDSLPALAD